jgi:trypsin
MKFIKILIQLSPIALSSGNLLRHRHSDDDETNERVLEKRIIGGFAAPDGRYPYTVSLQSPDSGHFCGGSLIAPDVILTAAHCAGGQYKAVIGRYDLGMTDGDAVPVKRELLHPRYNPSTTNNDFNLVFLTRQTTANVHIVKLNKEASIPSHRDPVEVMGWGDTDPSEWSQRLANKLHAVEVNVVSNEQCSQAKGYVGWFNYESYEGAITTSMLCAQDSNQDSCQGDSGGPLVIKGDDSSGAKDVQVGVVSWGVGCADSSFPGVYSRVSSAYNWIRSEVCANSIKPPGSFQCGNIENEASSHPPPPAPLPAVTVPIDVVTPPQTVETAPPPTPIPSIPEETSSSIPDSWSGIWCFFFGC